MVHKSTRKEIVCDMAKVVIEIKDNKDDKDKSVVNIKIQGLDKASDTEKGTSSMIYNKVCELLKSLN